MEKANNDIRSYAKEHHVMLWQIAKEYGLSDGNFSRKLRFELPYSEKQRIRSIIDRIASKPNFQEEDDEDDKAGIPGYYLLLDEEVEE